MNRNKGLTLIEVLVALVIISIALTAIIKSTAQNIKSTHYIQNKAMATWVGTYVINKARVGLLRLPHAPDHVSEDMSLLGITWTWEANLVATPNPSIQEVHVNVKPIDQENLIQLTSYLYAQ